MGASASTAASAAVSEPGLGRLWALAGALLAILFAVAYATELGRESEVVVDGALRLPPHPASRAALAEEPSAEAVQLTPTFEVTDPTTLELTLSRSADEGWVGVDIALIEEETGDMRQLGLATDVRGALGSDPESERTSTVLVDRVQPGHYVLRLSPSWEPLVEATAGEGASASPTPPTAHFRAVRGRRSHLGLALAAGALLLPPLVVTGRRLLRRRRPEKSEG